MAYKDKEKQRIKQKEYTQLPKVKARIKKYGKEYSKIPKVIIKRKKYNQKPRVKERQKKWSKRYYKKNKEYFSKKFKEYYQKYKIKIKKRIKKYRLLNKENISIKGKIYREKNKNKIKIKKQEENRKNNNTCLDCGIQILDVSKRCYHCAKAGERSFLWNGGISIISYNKDFNKKFKKAIRNRDNYTCLKCGKPEFEEKEKINQILSIHHINYDKKLSLKENCCTLCNRCNLEVNYKRKYYQQFFQSMLTDMYGYKYEEGDIILEVKKELKW